MKSTFRRTVLLRFLPLLLILVNPSEGQDLLSGFWDFATSVGVDPTDPGVSSTDTGAFPPDAGAFPPDTGAFLPDSGALPPDSGAFLPDSGVFTPDSGVFLADSANPTRQTEARKSDGANINSASGSKVDSSFTSEVKLKQGSQANTLNKPDLFPPVDPFDFGSGSTGKDSGIIPSFLPTMPKSSSSIGMVDHITKDSQAAVDPVKPVVPSKGKQTTGAGVVSAPGFNPGFGVDTSTSFGAVDIMPADVSNIGLVGSKKDTVPPVLDPGFGVDPAFDPNSIFGAGPDILGPVTDPGFDTLGPFTDPGFISNMGAPLNIPTAQEPSIPPVVTKPVTNIETPTVGQNTDPQILDPSRAQSFLSSLIGPSFNGGTGKPKTQPTKAIPDDWTQLYPSGRRPNKVEAGLTKLPSDPIEDAPMSNNEKQMVEISNMSFGKHRRLYSQLRKQRKEKRKALRAQRKQQRKQQRAEKQKSQSSRQQKNVQRQGGRGPRTASLAIPVVSKRTASLFIPNQGRRGGRGRGRSKRMAPRCNRRMQRRGLCLIGPGNIAGQAKRRMNRMNRKRAKQAGNGLGIVQAQTGLITGGEGNDGKLKDWKRKDGNGKGGKLKGGKRMGGNRKGRKDKGRKGKIRTLNGKEKKNKPPRSKKVRNMTSVDLSGSSLADTSGSDPPPGTEMHVLEQGGAPVAVSKEQVETVGGMTIVWVK